MKNMPRKIAVVLPDWMDYCHHLMLGIRSYAKSRRGIVVEEFRQYGHLGASPVLFRWQPDGIIIFADIEERQLLRTVRHIGVPIVNTSSVLPDTGIPSVHVDLNSVVAVAQQHFEIMGFKSYGFVGLQDHPASEELFPIWKEYIASRKLRGTYCFLKHLINTDEHEPELEALLRRGPGPVGLLCVEDIIGEHVCSVAQKMALRIPEQIGVLGLANTKICLACKPHLSSVRLPGEQVGYHAAAMLDRLMNKQSGVDLATTIPSDGVAIRGSTSLLGPRGLNITGALRFIRENASKGITVDAVLAEQSVSRVTFDKHFRQLVGHSAAVEIRNAKVDHARHLLRSTDLTVTRIAALCGFSSASQFSIIFDKVAKMTPSAFRRSNQQMEGAKV